MGIISGCEDYNVIKVSCKELFSDINEVITEGEINVDEHIIPLEFYLSGDYKVTIIVTVCGNWNPNVYISFNLYYLVPVTCLGNEWTNI